MNGDNLREYSVSEIAFALKRTIEDAYGLVRVRGEISGFKRAASGHCYFALKDDRAVLDAVCWKGSGRRLSFAPEDGLEVVCSGQLTTYPGRSRYQLVVEHMEPAGVGALMALLEERNPPTELLLQMMHLVAHRVFAGQRHQFEDSLVVLGLLIQTCGVTLVTLLPELLGPFAKAPGLLSACLLRLQARGPGPLGLLLRLLLIGLRSLDGLFGLSLLDLC